MTNGQAPVTLCRQTCFCSDTTLSLPVKFLVVTLAIVNPDFITKKQLNPSRFGSNKNYKLIDTLLLFALCNKYYRVFSMQRDCSP